MSMLCAKIGNTYVNTANITHFTYYDPKETLPIAIALPKDANGTPVALNETDSEPAMLNIHLMGGEKLEFTGPKAE